MHLPEEAFTYTLKEDLLHLNSRELSSFQGYFPVHHHPTVEGLRPSQLPGWVQNIGRPLLEGFEGIIFI
jgi:hypothetical protein